MGSSVNPYDDERRNSRFPRKIGSIVNQLMARRGYAQMTANEELQAIIGQTIGKQLAGGIRVGNLRRGVLELYANDSVTLQELTFMKRKMLKAISKAMPNSDVKDLRFRISG